MTLLTMDQMDRETWHDSQKQTKTITSTGRRSQFLRCLVFFSSKCHHNHFFLPTITLVLIINTSIMNGYWFEISGKLHSVASSTLGYSLQVKIPFNTTFCGFLFQLSRKIWNTRVMFVWTNIDIVVLSGKHETMDTFSASKNTFQLKQCMGCD